MAKKTHTTFAKGTKCFVKLKDGETFVAKFVDRNDRFVFFEGRKVPHSELASCGKYVP